MPDHFKVALRNTIKQVRSNTSASYRSASSNQICTRIRSLSAFQNAKKIAIYFAINGEIDLTTLWETGVTDDKEYFFPILNDNLTLSFLPATPATPFKKNHHGIPEPDVASDLKTSVEDLDLILMPIVGFDMRCTRLGMGAGYYDRTLENKKYGTLYGVAFQFQRVDFIEPQPWDVPMDAVITQKAIYWREPPDNNII